jgi:hypothetical protein
MTERPSEPTPDDVETDDETPASEPRPVERAAFLDDFPDSPELLPLIMAFQSGRYAELRKLEAELRARSTDPEVLTHARELVERTETDPTATKLLLLAVGFFLFILFWVYGIHGH